MEGKTGIERAVEIAGGQSSLARLIGVPQPRVNNWVTLGYVPTAGGRAERVAELTSVPIEDLRRADPRKRRTPKPKQPDVIFELHDQEPEPPHVSEPIQPKREPVQRIGRSDRRSLGDLYPGQGRP